MEEEDVVHANSLEKYGRCLHVALGCIFGGSLMRPANVAEVWIQSLMMLIGSALWSYIIAAGCGVIASAVVVLVLHAVHRRHPSGRA